ncbi:MAG: hypothetical protein CMK52_04600 [Proteobacteria bacterium]|nr:hypothetical protein [Pseudomonadota bacterium]
MVKPIFFTFFTLFTLVINTTSLNATQWTKVAKGSNFSEYYGNISKSGRIASMDCLRDYVKESVKKTQNYLSKKHSLKFDCARKKFREISVTYFEENMMAGALLKKQNVTTDWKSVDPDSLTELLFKKACK